MRRFSTVDLDTNLGGIKAAAAREPVIITEHRKDRFVMMSVEDFRKLRQGADPKGFRALAERPRNRRKRPVRNQSHLERFA